MCKFDNVVMTECVIEAPSGPLLASMFMFSVPEHHLYMNPQRGSSDEAQSLITHSSCKQKDNITCIFHSFQTSPSSDNTSRSKSSLVMLLQVHRSAT